MTASPPIDSPRYGLALLGARLRQDPSWALIEEAIGALNAAQVPVTAIEAAACLDEIEFAACRMLSPEGNPKSFLMEAQAFQLPPLLARFERAARNGGYWTSKQEQLVGALTVGQDSKLWTRILLGAMVCDATMLGCGEALARFLFRIAAAGPDVIYQLLPIPGGQFGPFLDKCGWFDGDLEPIDAVLARMKDTTLSGQDQTFAKLALTAARLFVQSRFPDRLLDIIYHRLIIPALELSARDASHFDILSEMEEIAYRQYLRRHESEERFHQVYKVIGPLLFASGKTVASQTPLDGGSFRSIPMGPRPKVAFVLPNDSILAHTQNLLTFLRGFAAMSSKPIEPVVYLMSCYDQQRKLLTILGGLNIAVKALPTGHGHTVLGLRETSIADGITAVIWVSTPAFLCFAAGLGVAPVLIWWSMKYHRMAVPGIDGYMTTGGFFEDFRQIGDRLWRSCRSALPPLTDPAAGVEADALRRDLGAESGAVIIGCVGREEKLLGAGYLEAVAAIMTACPNARFIWTGQPVRSSEVKGRLAAFGIESRCRFLGWLPNTKTATQALDLYLDSFPFASGHTAFEAMAAGAPVVVLKTPEALETSTLTAILPALEGRAGSPAEQADIKAIFTGAAGESLAPFVENVDQYVGLSVSLILNADLRRRVGQACKTFVERYAGNERGNAESTCRHIVEIIAEKSAASA